MNSRNISNGSTIKQISFGCYLNYDVFTYFGTEFTRHVRNKFALSFVSGIQLFHFQSIGNIDFALLNGYASLGVFMIKSVFKVRSMIPSHTFQKFVLYLIWKHK